jgi:eukaryotic-like serine/threonine-protein kinase
MKHLFALIALSCAPLGAHAEDWPAFMRDAARTGQAQGAGRITDLKLAWTLPLHASVSASPVVSGGCLFVAAENGNIRAFDLKTRKPLWLFHTEGSVASTPAIADERLHVLSRDGWLYTLSLDGQLLWRFRTGGEQRFAAVGGYGLDPALGPVPDPWDLYQSSPLVHGGKVYFGSSDGHVRALDAATGREVWSYAAGDPVHSSPTYADGKIFIGTWGTKLLALDALTGVKVWEFQGKADRKQSILLGMASAPSSDGETVYVGARDGFLYALDVRTGALKWKYAAGGSWILSTAAIDSERLYFGTSDTGLFVTLDKRDGRVLSQADTRVWTYASSPLVGDTVFTATMTGWLYAFDKRTGRQLWRWQTPAGARDEEDIVDEVGKLRGEALFGPGRQLQGGVERVKALGAFVASPIWVEDQLIAITATGEVLGFRRP